MPTTPIRESDVTDEGLFLNRREILRWSAIGTIGALAGGLTGCPGTQEAQAASSPEDTPKLSDVLEAPPKYRVDEEPTSYKYATSYNNFYEFGTGKRDPAANAHSLKPEPWSVVVDGEVEKPGVVPLETLLRPHTLEERIYRFRCVEAWSMIIPWVGIPLGDVLKRFEPTSKARYVSFETLVDPQQMPGQKRNVLDWPYREGLRIDEAMNPLAILAVGMYGRVLPNQNGAPLRLIVPWKYGFKSIKSIVRISFTNEQPRTSWNDQAAGEYGFYANVNPEVDHPRWSQSRERRLGEFRKRPTLMLNGYADEVGSLYTGMDLKAKY